MKTKLIMIPTPIIVSSEEIEEDDVWVYICHINGVDFGDNKGPIVKNNIANYLRWFDKLHDKKNYFKVIAGTPELPQIDWNNIESEFGYVDVDKLAERQVEKEGWGVYDSNSEQFAIKNSYIEGFKKAQQLNDKKFSERDMRKAMLIMYDECVKNFISDVFYDGIIKNTIQSLQQPKVFDIEVEMEVGKLKTYGRGFTPSQPKITNNKIKIIKRL